jgi:phosphinothricin acetyltransferase
MPTHIRLATPADAGQVREIYAPFCEDSPVSFEIRPPSVAEMASRIGTVTQTYPWLVCQRGNDILGYAYACQHRERAAYRWADDVSIYVAPDWRGRRIGKGLLAALGALLRLQGFFRAYGGVALPNPASVGLLESSGFQPVGVYHRVGFKSGAWHDVGWWVLVLKSPTPDPAEPLRLAELDSSSAWQDAIRQGEGVFGTRLEKVGGA